VLTLLLRLLVVTAGVLALLAAGAWVAVDWRAASMVRDELRGFGLERVLEIREAALPSPTRFTIEGAVLRDPLGGKVVARLEHLEVLLSLWDRGPAGRVLAVNGQGGEVFFDEHDGNIGFVRAIDALLGGIEGRGLARAVAPPAAPAGEDVGPAAPPPVLTFTGATATLLDGDGEPQVFRNLTARIEPGHETSVNVDVPGGGHVALRFDGSGLRKVNVAGVAVTPAAAVLLPGSARSVGRELRPSGTLDLDLDIVPGDPGATRATGIMREAAMHPGYVPFPCERGNVPFSFAQGRLTVSDAQLAFPGGVAHGGLVADADGFVLTVKVEDARFLKQDMGLLPRSEQLAWLQPEDGGNLNLDLRLTSHTGRPGLEVDGWGGVFLEHMRVGPHKALLENVVGSLDIHNQVLDFHEVSGRCAGGTASLKGSYDLRTGEVIADGSVFDADVARLDRELQVPGAGERQVAGWLEGSMHWRGIVGEIRTLRGSGHLSIRGGYLWSMPLLDAVSRGLGMSKPPQERSDAVALRFRQRGNTFDVDSLDFHSDVLALRGQGRVKLTGEVNLDITPLPVSGTIGAVLQYLQQQLVKIELRGTYTNPEVRVIPLNIVMGPLERFWDWLTGGPDDAALSAEDEPPPGPP
jgi:hypothetical protein